jgi:hypothetical protein
MTLKGGRAERNPAANEPTEVRNMTRSSPRWILSAAMGRTRWSRQIRPFAALRIRRGEGSLLAMGAPLTNEPTETALALSEMPFRVGDVRDERSHRQIADVRVGGVFRGGSPVSVSWALGVPLAPG